MQAATGRCLLPQSLHESGFRLLLRTAAELLAQTLQSHPTLFSCTVRASACAPLRLLMPDSARVHCRLGRVRRTVACLSWRACSAWQPPGRGLGWPPWHPGGMTWHRPWRRPCPQASIYSGSSLSM